MSVFLFAFVFIPAVKLTTACCQPAEPQYLQHWTQAVLDLDSGTPESIQRRNDAYSRAISAAPEPSLLLAELAHFLGCDDLLHEFRTLVIAEADRVAPGVFENEPLTAMSKDQIELLGKVLERGSKVSLQGSPPELLVQKLRDAINSDITAKAPRDVLNLYLASLELDPSNRLAWFDLARDTDSDVAMIGAEGLTIVDPENSAGWYFLALWHFRRNDSQSAFDCIERAGELRNFRIYRPNGPPMPTGLYPKREPFLEFGVTETPVSRGWLSVVLYDVEDRVGHLENLRPCLTALQEYVRQRASDAENSGDLDAAVRHHLQLNKLGWQLAASAPPVSIAFSQGVQLINLAPANELERLLRRTDRFDELNLVVSRRAAWKELTQESKEAYLRPLEAEPEPLLRGEVDPLGQRNAAIEKVSMKIRDIYAVKPGK